MRKFTATLNTESIDNLIKDLTEYKESLSEKTQRLVDELLDKGIARAETVKGKPGTYGTHGMEKYVTFTKELDVDKYGCYGMMLGVGSVIESKWYSLEEKERNGSISSILALEFGTAATALEATSMFGGHGGRGTNARYGHENDTDWYFITGFEADGRPIYKHATSITPTRPMMNAANEMIAEIYKTARRIFSQ